ncbi:MAG: DUF2157 domain-containing protein [Verrucomicrobiales bacterium]|nr:DUF2157 domain-containing protein [Verrucomicrobiales bacterium]
MPGNEDISKRELTRDELEQLAAAGLIREDRRHAVLAAYRESIDWKAWAGLWSATLGAVFLLAGVIFFFAWNWKELSPSVRFAVLGGSIVLGTAGALIAGIRSCIGQWLLVAASVFTGVLVAVYGQVYQTGADAFEVFALWAVLIFGWVLVGRFAPLWMLWLVVLQTALATWAGQVLVPAGTIGWPAVNLVLGLLLVGSLGLREWLEAGERFAWLRGEWIRVVLVTGSVIWLTAIPWGIIFELRWGAGDHQSVRVIGVLIWVVAVTGGALFFTRIRPSLSSVGICVLSGAVILVSWLGEALFENDLDSAGTWLVLGILVILTFSVGAAIIAMAARMIEEGAAPSGGSDGRA